MATREALYGEGELVARFGREWVVQTKGRWAGQPLVLEGWEEEFLDELFLQYEDGTRVYQEALLGVARKNGKSTLSALIALYLLLGAGEEGPEVYSAAYNKEQARIVFNQAKEFIEQSRRLSDWLTPHKDVILCQDNNGIYRVLSSDAPGQYGLNPFGVVIDELWAHKNPELYYALTTGQGAREDPLVVSITTAGYDQETICAELYERGKNLLALPDPLAEMRRTGFYFKWYEADPTVTVEDPEGWKAANPSSWISHDDLKREAERLPENVFRRLHLNQWTESADSWIKAQHWDQCEGLPLFDPGQPTYMAVDLGIRKDTAAIVWGQWHGYNLHVGQKILVPEEEGPTFGVADVRAQVGTTASQLGNVREIPFDPWSFRESAEMLQERGVPMVEFPQTQGRMGPASENVYELVTEGRIVHNGDREARRQILATVAAATDRGGWMISKRKSREKIDFTVALAMMADRAVTLRNAKPVRRGAAFL